MQYRIGSVTLSPARRELLSDGLARPVEPLVLDLILYLVRHRMRVVGKDELISALWQGRAVADSSLSSCIKAARRALGDDGRAQRLIRTLHRRGFRFVGEVGEQPETETAAALPPDGATASLAVQEDSSYGIDLSLPRRPSIAVLPFTLDPSSEDASEFGRALQRDVTLGLAQTRWLFVTAHASAAHLASLVSDPAEIGRRLGVRYLLGGRLAKAGQRFRLSLNLTDIAERREIWVERFERAVDDVFAAQEEISDLVAAGVEAEIDRRERLSALLRPIDSLDAWTAYHKASDLLNRYAPDSHGEIDRLLTLAARVEPDSSRIAAARSFLSWQRVFLETAEDRAAEIRRAFDHARHAIELDPRDANGHWTLGRAALLQEDLDMAVEEIRTAVSLNRNFAKAQYSLAWASRLRDGSGEVLANVDLARRLSPYDPLSFAFMNLKGDLHLLNGDHSAAAEWTARAMRQPYRHYHAFANAARIQHEAGRAEAAEAFMAELKRRRPGYTIGEYFRAFPYTPALRPAIGETLRQLGLR